MSAFGRYERIGASIPSSLLLAPSCSLSNPRRLDLTTSAVLSYCIRVFWSFFLTASRPSFWR
eukprot:scaffold220720_cov13-Prasinocladus_malaysianus.AAC.1